LQEPEHQSDLGLRFATAERLAVKQVAEAFRVTNGALYPDLRIRRLLTNIRRGLR